MLVDHQCPRCGAPVTLEDTDRLFLCCFCRVRLYIISKNFPRYALVPPAAVNGDLIYHPYWRFRGMHFSVVPFEVRQKVLDKNHRATRLSFLPESVGMRAQALRLRFATPGMKGRFLRPALPLEEVISRVEGGSHFAEYGSHRRDAFHRAFVGEALSIVYSPIYVKGRGIFDAVLKRPIASYTAVRADALAASAERNGKWKPGFVPALCPYCGWDLEGGRESVALFCGNCDRGWSVSGGRFKKLLFASMAPGAKDAYYFPFWRIKAEVEHRGSVMRTRGDFLWLANLTGGTQKGREKDSLSFWAPAFRSAPRLYLRLSRQLSVLDPGAAPGERLPRGGLCPVSIGLEESARALKVIMASIAVSKGEVFPELPGIKVNHKDALLVYVPFRRGAHDLIQPEMNISIPGNALRGFKPGG